MKTELDLLEAEAIYILRETVAQMQRPVMLFSGGKDSTVMTRLAEKAFRPAAFPFPLMLIDTGHNFPETNEYIKHRMHQICENLIVGSVQDSIDAGRVQEELGPYSSRNRLQSVTLLDMIYKHRFDAVIGGGRRDEEKARAKERVFSLRNRLGQWEPHNQRAELWNLYNGRVHDGEHLRVFPLSNWTELDVWQYIRQENLDVPRIYFSHVRPCVRRDGVIWAHSSFMQFYAEDQIENLRVRFRTVGDMTCTAAMESTAATVDEVISETRTSRLTERGLRQDDKRSESAMEDRKKEGYF